MDVLVCFKVRPKSENSGAAIGMKLEHLDRVAEIEVEDFVRGKHMHFGVGSRFEKVVDGRAHGAVAARHSYAVGGDEGLAVEAALDRVRFELQQEFDLIGGHRF